MSIPLLTSQIKENLLSDLNERKIVKTISLKKVAAVAVASLGFGLLSVVPAQAAQTTTSATLSLGAVTRATVNTWTVTATLTFVGTEGATPTLANNTSAVVAGTGVAGANPTGVVTVGATTVVSSTGASGAITTYVASAPVTITSATNANVSNVVAAAGNYTIKIVDSVNTTAAVAAQAVATVLPTTGGTFIDGTYSSGSTSSAALQIVNGQATLQFIQGTSDTSYTVTSTGVGTMLSATGSTTASTPLNGVSASGGVTWAPATTIQKLAVVTTSSVAGVQTLTFQPIGANGAPGTAVTATITYGAAPVLTASTSTAFLSAGTDCAASNDAGGVSLASTAGAGAAQATICIALKDQNSAAINGQALSVTIAGPGLISIKTANTTGDAGNVRATSLTATTQAATNLATVGITADGTSGVGTITVTSGTTVIATKTVTFYGAVKTLTAKQNHVIASTAGAVLGDGSAAPAGTSIATTPAVVITAQDANGVLVPGLTITAKSSDTTVMTETITVAEDDGTKGAGAGTYNVRVNSAANTSGKAATLTFRVMSGTTVLAATAAVPYTLGGAVATVALSLDKATYTQGSAAVATLTMKDASGNPVFDGDHANITAALDTSMSVVKTLAFSATANSAGSLGGKSSISFNAPASATAVWTISGKVGSGASVDALKAISATASVTDASAALNTRIDSLNAKIVALTALIAKIMKSLKIK